jgi:hypothetical protein
VREYRCYFLSPRGQVTDTEGFLCTDDEEALARAKRLFETRFAEYGMELWKGERKLHVMTREGREGLARSRRTPDECALPAERAA